MTEIKITALWYWQIKDSGIVLLYETITMSILITILSEIRTKEINLRCHNDLVYGFAVGVYNSQE